MHTITPTFQINNESERHSMKGERIALFHIDDAHDAVYYKPLRLRFSLEYDESLACIEVMDLRARLTHAGDIDMVPTLDDLRVLALEAIHVFMMFSEVCISRSHPPPSILWLQPEPGDNSYGVPF